MPLRITRKNWRRNEPRCTGKGIGETFEGDQVARDFGSDCEFRLLRRA
jgi:hypothetical protein